MTDQLLLFIATHKTSLPNRTQTARPHPFVSLPERMRTACDRSGATGKERDAETGYDISRHERREYILIFEVNNTSGWESATRLRKGHKGIIPNKKGGGRNPFGRKCQSDLEVDGNI